MEVFLQTPREAATLQLQVDVVEVARLSVGHVLGGGTLEYQGVITFGIAYLVWKNITITASINPKDYGRKINLVSLRNVILQNLR